jgi:hypothetical protein
MGIRTISTGFDITTGSRRPALPLYRSTPALTEIAPMFTIEGFIESCRKAIVGPTRRQRSASSSPKRSPIGPHKPIRFAGSRAEAARQNPKTKPRAGGGARYSSPAASRRSLPPRDSRSPAIARWCRICARALHDLELEVLVEVAMR